MVKCVKLVALVFALAVFTTVAFAFTWNVSSSVSFDVPLTLTKQTDINFGTVKAVTASTYTITTAGAVSATGSGAALYGTPTAGNITISGSAIQTINISVGSLVANNGVTLQNPTCSYNGGASGSCTINSAAAPGGGKTLLLGIQAVVSGAQAANTSAAPTLIVTVVYT